ncbi:uncharacterized protein LOC142163006 [Nicotiana tabacum]|uniref:Uncharacterized protein LOC142163006 n=1 Tax=Nicotiana tabacum TaxID=4097 RepID=A0AC58RUF3_TOBAC
MEDRDEVLYSGPYTISNKPIIIKPWRASFDFQVEVLQTVPIWAKFPNLPLSCWGMDSLSRTRSGLGIPLYADKCTTKVERILYARILIEMDVTRELPTRIKVGHTCKPMQKQPPAIAPKIKITNPKQAWIKKPEKTADTQNFQYVMHIGCAEENKGQSSYSKDPGDSNTLFIPRLNLKFNFTTIYGLHTIKDRKQMWANLRALNQLQIEPWLVMGDFNTISHAEDKQCGAPVHEGEIRDFNDYLVDTNMNEMRYIGRWFTWTNNHVFSKIDRALVNAEWMIRFPKKEVLVLDPNLSDHSPLCIKMDEENFQGPRTFSFLNCIAEHHNFLKVVNEAWQIPMGGSWMNRVWMRLKGMKEGLKQINTKELRGID